MRKILTGLAWILATAAAPAWAAPDASEQAQYDSFVVAAGASTALPAPAAPRNPTWRSTRPPPRKT